MTRAEEAALKAYPQNGDNLISQEGYWLMRSIYADGYEAGYDQAEKDLKEALTEYINKELAENKEWKDTCLHDRYFGGYGVALENVLEKLNEL